MYGVLKRLVESEGQDQQERLMLCIDKMLPREQNNAIGQLFEYWRYKSLPDGLPRVNDFDYKSALPEDVLRKICWADVSAEDPFNFVTRDHAKLTAFQDASNHRLRDLPSRMHYRACASEYMLSIKMRKPIFHDIDQTVGSISRNYMRLMLPVADETGRVVRLVYAVRIVSGATSSSS